MVIRRFWFPLLALAILAGCTAGPDYVPVEPEVPDAWEAAVTDELYTPGTPGDALRYMNDPEAHERIKHQVRSGEVTRFDAAGAQEAGLVTIAADEIDYEEEVRVAIEERASLSPDALTGMEASLRFPGPESMQTKIFGRLSAWQNWIFQRPNAVGPRGALMCYGTPNRAEFAWSRT